jgi:hypothetical protein
MQSSSGEPEGAFIARAWSLPAPSFAVTITLVILALSIGYALLVSHMIYVSMVEQHLDPGHVRYRYEGPVHFHNPVEWFLIAFPAVLGWVGTIGSLNVLYQRWRHR